MAKSIVTREIILRNAFELIYLKGYQATSIDEIIATTKVTKGAFYYHFGSKDNMGLAVINEVIYPAIHESLILPLKNSAKPVKDIYRVTENALFAASFFKVKYGCPLSNMIQEVSPLNHDFSVALMKLSDRWRDALKQSIKNGKKAAKIRPGVNEDQVADFIISGYWGIRNLAKLQNSAACFTGYLEELKRYLKSLQ